MSIVGKRNVLAAAGNAGGGAVYVDDVFSTHSHLGDGTNAGRVVNGIDLSSRGGAVWFFNRDDNNADKTLITTDLGGVNYLKTSTQNALQTSGSTSGIQALHDDGFTVGEYGIENVNNEVTVSWTFAKQEKFFDVVTYTGTGNARTIAHNLNSVPGMIWVKKTSGSSIDWIIYHSGSIKETNHTTTIDANHEYLQLNTQGGSVTSTGMFNGTAPTSTVFSVGVNAAVNNNNEQYVAYLFAHNNNDGIFGEDEDQDIIKCGNFKDDGAGNGLKEYSLGFEPQWLLIKAQSGAGQWLIIDTQRGWAGKSAPIGDNLINTKVAQNPTKAELNLSDKYYLTSDGFAWVGDGSNLNFVYVAIRRSNKPASEFTSSQLFSMAAGSNTHNGFRNGIITDFAFAGARSGTDKYYLSTRSLNPGALNTINTAAQSASNFGFDQKDTTGFFEATGTFNGYFGWGWRRTTGFCDQIIYEGTGNGNRRIPHNLGVIPEMIWIKCLNSATPGGSTANWVVGVKALSDAALAAGTTPDIFLYLNSQVATATALNHFGSYTFREGSYSLDGTTSSSESLVIGNGDAVNRNGFHYMAMLFASVPGISKIGTYTGSSSAQTIDCGFSNGAKFVLTKSHNDGGEWNMWDTTRGIVAGDDKQLFLNRNTTEGEVDYIDPHSSGFSLPNNSVTNSNAQGQKYIFYAIAT